MDSTATSDQGIPGSNVLLAEILSVLKNIDGHLKHQDKRLSDLDTKLSILANATEKSTSIPETRHSTRNAQADTAEIQRHGSVAGSSPSSRQRELPVVTESRHGSFDSRHGPEFVKNFPVDENRENRMPRNLKLRALTQRPEIVRRITADSPKTFINSFAQFGGVGRMGTWNSLEAPPTAMENESDEEIVESHDLTLYAKYPPPDKWITTRTKGEAVSVKWGSEEAHNVWREYVSDSWTILPDGRVEMTFQQHILERLDKDQAVLLLKTLQAVSLKLEFTESEVKKRGSFRIKDIEFDPEYEFSVADYRAEFPVGPVRKHRIHDTMRRASLDPPKTAPWKRIIEVRGLSKKIIDENELHEIWQGKFRDPFYEGLPAVDYICPFFTHRISDHGYEGFTGMKTAHEALSHHQNCRRRPPQSDDDLCFHITFYELIDVTNEHEFDDELWISGRPHSDNESGLEAKYGVKNRRLRESACTIVLVTDPNILQYWTMIYLCPNTFDPYETKEEKFEQYGSFSHAFKDKDAAAGLELMIEFSIRMVIERWEKIAEYFAWLIGNRDTLSDPAAHDSLLFDDDSFSRSRKYFWAINYLAELDSSISANILQMERFVKTNTMLRDQLGRLQYLRQRLRDQRNKAIALRDGLFSASGVMESRASTRLGENVKLLTFVSIFFLPLSFCMSVWSVNDTIFSLRALLIVTVLVGLGTYCIVFNLDTLASFVGRAYSSRKARLIEQMRSDSDLVWKERGESFAIFQPRHENVKPSEWTILAFIFHKFFQRFAVRKAPSEDKKKPRDIRAVPTQDMLSWQDIELPVELSRLKTQLEGTSEIRRTSIRDHIARFGRSITMRREALAPESPNV